ncbi:hypothetical protein KL942_001611 [Ogataea angusta]|uniref:Maintenance of telomere capping protein 4 n=1 Tax=Pichia angusta TaxID=870730 RepID=A0ABQ7S014_PICAN|nr:hypothetical protein KL920_001800 [Ogataea angusta]KAG7834706.1 hypothetical protein KL943_003090 [Ogataea angusta]KAG7841732.1 hypothetical protein KL942_001611 [Ogataea angusta]KAG7850690.1 hypothetical protein KL940_001267 [Ogataea angusta]KAG7862051.1 hypothetical protein KL939_001072 [Ogataea angusta]
MTVVLDTQLNLKKYKPIKVPAESNGFTSHNSLLSSTLTNDSNKYEGLVEETQELLDARKSLVHDLKLSRDQVHDLKVSVEPRSKFEPTIHEDKSFQICRKRAEKVKTIIQSYYDFIDLYQNTVHYDDNDHQSPLYEGVEGVFNPLQIIRNRRIRKKYNEKLTTFPLGDYKPPSRVFSKYNRQHLIWQVNLNEYYNDITWREKHWHELKKPNGELWFPKLDSAKQTPQKNRRLKSLHEQLFVGFDGEFHKDDDDSSGDDRRLSSLARVNGSSASLARLEHYRLNSLKRTPGHTRSLKSDEDFDTPSSRNSSIDRLSFLSQGGKSSESLSPAHQIDSEETGNCDDLTDQKKMVKGLQSKLALAESRIRIADYHREDIIASKGNEIKKQLELFESTQTQTSQISQSLQTTINKVDAILDRFNQFNNAKSYKIEELLGYCDRTNGEINTSITLRIRNIQEKKDQLSNTNDEWLFQLVYSFLENLIVLALWIVWIIVEFWRLIKRIFSILMKLLKFIFL